MSLYAWGSDANGELGLGGRDDEQSYNIPQIIPWPESANFNEAAFGDQVR